MPPQPDIRSQLETLRRIITDQVTDAAKRTRLLAQQREIEQQLQESAVRIGIVGEFSSGKSTLINSLIGADYFVTNAIQGTTTITTSIRYASSINLELKYKNGTIISYNTGKEKLIKKYLPDEYENLSFMQRAALLVLSLVGANEKHDLFHKLFDHVTTSDEVAREVDEVIVYYPSEVLRRGIIIVDTPGTDSSNPEHTRITESAIADKCDVSMVIIPRERPLSQTLSDFVERNFPKNKHLCYFMVTKIEQERREADRARLLKGLSMRIQRFLDIEHPKIIPAPTLLSLETRGLVEPTGLFNHLSAETRQELVRDFERQVEALIREIEQQKAQTVRQALAKKLRVLADSLRTVLAEQQEEIRKQLADAAARGMEPLEAFASKFFAASGIDNALASAQSYLQRDSATKANTLTDKAIREIKAAGSKSKALRVMSLPQLQQAGQQLFAEHFHAFKLTVAGMLRTHTQLFEAFIRKVQDTYQITPREQHINHTPQIKPSWQTGFYFSLDYPKLSTFFLTVFCELSSIQNAMLKLLPPQLARLFQILTATYEEHLTTLHKRLRADFDKELSRFISRNKSAVNQRIEEWNADTQKLKERLNSLREAQKLLDEYSGQRPVQG